MREGGGGGARDGRMGDGEVGRGITIPDSGS